VPRSAPENPFVSDAKTPVISRFALLLLEQRAIRWKVRVLFAAVAVLATAVGLLTYLLVSRVIQ
jgi:hypothetical protein